MKQPSAPMIATLQILTFASGDTTFDVFHFAYYFFFVSFTDFFALKFFFDRIVEKPKHTHENRMKKKNNGFDGEFNLIVTAAIRTHTI